MNTCRLLTPAESRRFWRIIWIMTSGVYPRKPGKSYGPPRRFDATTVARIRADKAKGWTTKFVSSKWRADEKLIRQVLRGTGAYKGM